MKIIDRDRVLRLYTYDRVSGQLIWNERNISDFRNPKIAAQWNGRYAGRPAGQINVDGYVVVKVDGSFFKAHRIIWVMETGEQPDIMDHIDGRKANNRFENLRSVSKSVNGKNQPLRSDNTHGVPGVYWDAHKERWVATAFVEGRSINLGRFKTKGEAIAARRQSEPGLGYHPNHGRAA